MRKWNAKERALFALLAAPFAAVCVVGATSSEAAARLWERRFGTGNAAVETPYGVVVESESGAPPVGTPVGPPSTARKSTQPETQTTQARAEPANAETPEPDWTIAEDGALERREARSAVDAGRVAVSTEPDGTREGSAPSPPERTPNGLAPASPPVDSSQGAPVIPGTNDQWARGFDDRWLAVEKERRNFKPIADNSGVYALGTQGPGHTYGNHTERETALWAAETERLVVEGSLIFHDANLLGSKNGVSCDMCHPDAEGTHAETYPKYQVQLGRSALLRDMANWCLTQPCRGEPMSGDDPRMRALEAYMISARAGKTLEYGKR